MAFASGKIEGNLFEIATYSSSSHHNPKQEGVSAPRRLRPLYPTHYPSHHVSTTKTKTRRSPRKLTCTRPASQSLLFLLVIIASCCTLATSQPLIADYDQAASYLKKVSDSTLLADDSSAELVDVSGPLEIDTSPPPAGVDWHRYPAASASVPEAEIEIDIESPERAADPSSHEEGSYLHKRDDVSSGHTTTTSYKSSSTRAIQQQTASASGNADAKSQSSDTTEILPPTSTPTGTVASSTDSAILASATVDSNTPLPSPFDKSLGNNYTTTTCPLFIKSFLADDQFKACLPVSLLLQNSDSFFQAEKSLVRITQVLDATCSANVTQCTSYLWSLAKNLTSTDNCAADLAAQNPTVMQAHTGLLAYPSLYTATCLHNPSTNAYCFADAITNASSITDSYVYFLPLNMSLPASSQPTCSKCLKNTMAVFNSAAANLTLAIADTYTAAAAQINVQCGPGFVQATLPVTGGATGQVGGSLGFAALLMVVMAWLL